VGDDETNDSGVGEGIGGGIWRERSAERGQRAGVWLCSAEKKAGAGPRRTTEDVFLKEDGDDGGSRKHGDAVEQRETCGRWCPVITVYGSTTRRLRWRNGTGYGAGQIGGVLRGDID